ncbi:MAG: HAD family hydrolase [Planctomycetes bacterium]|nr:HAD family hydrolase [Planctomycetota bacterium]
MPDYPWSKKKLQAVVFDMDGTLLNSGIFGVRAIQRAFRTLIDRGRLPGVTAPPSPEMIKLQIGKPPGVFYKDLLPPELRAQSRDLHTETTRNELAALADGSGGLFDGAVDVLDKLKRAGLKLLLVSNCSEAYIEGVVSTFGLDRLLDYSACVGDHPPTGRTKSALVGEGLKLVGAEVGVMVGDRVHDAEAAKDNGLWFIGCTYGYGKPEEFKDAAVKITDIRDLPKVLGIA